MKIKDIRQYRQFYKEEIRDLTNRDENFIGTFYIDPASGKRKYGWFEIYHGDKEGYGKAEEGIGNFLQSFLDMAKDGQAVYEFLQNAVDAKSTHFTMAWGKDEVDGNNYVLIANNGDMFDFDSVRSILNVGSSTKTANSQNIGKFGIGFKLAHRLVGKENGLDELLSDNPSGPLLFSWSNYELSQLAEGEMPNPRPIAFKPLGNNKFQIQDNNPWLFKILITCFPALPENGHHNEQIKLVDGSPAIYPVFRKEEYGALCRWVKKYSDILNQETYNQGALFFIKLGSGKENDLADHNLTEGVRFSLAILQETSDDRASDKTVLETVQLNRNAPIQKPNLNFLYFTITKNENLSDYLFVRFGVKDEEMLSPEQKIKLQREDNIEVLFGFRNFDRIGDYFKGAPNFYLYFPLSEEVHNFNFVLHSNAFYKASSRTFLHKGTIGEEGINERLLRTIANRLRNELTKLFHSSDNGDKQKFLHLYAALLSSKESNNYDRKWVKEPFIDELTKTLKTCIPVRSSFDSNDFSLYQGKVHLKKTAIEIDAKEWGLNEILWFYWGYDAPDIIRWSAVEKLEVQEFDIFTLLQVEDIATHVNNWIDKDRARITAILNELNLLLDRNKINESFKKNLSNLKLFEFTDGRLFSINEVTAHQEQGYIILHNKLADVKNELIKCGLKTSTINLDKYHFYQNYNSYFSAESQLRSQPTLIKIFSDNINDETSGKLSLEEKVKIFCVFRDMIEEGKRGERLRELKLFTNHTGKCVALKHILQKTEISWLRPFLLNEKERHPDVDRYLLNVNEKIYENIIYPFWEDIARAFLKKVDTGLENIFDDIRNFYALCEHSKEEQLLLSDYGFVFFQNEFVEVNNPYFHENLNNIPSEIYEQVQNALHALLNIQIPDLNRLDDYKGVPFKFSNKNNPLDFESIESNRDEIKMLLVFCKTCNLDVFSTHTINIIESDKFILSKDKIRNYFTPQQKIKEYVVQYLSGKLIALPDEFTEFSTMLSMQSDNLAAFFIEDVDIENSEQSIQLTQVLLGEKDEILITFLDKCESIILDTNWTINAHNEIKLKFLKRLLTSDQDYLETVQKKIVLQDNEKYFHLSSIDIANDSVTLPLNEKTIKLSRAMLLGFEDDNGIRKTFDFAKHTSERDLLSEKESKRLFKIKDTGVTDELIALFNESLVEKKLTNCHQLALVLTCNLISRADGSSYKVEDADSVWQDLSGNWVLPAYNNELYDKNYILSTKYNDLASILQLDTNEVMQYGEVDNDADADVENEDILISGFLFQTGCSISIFKAGSDQLELMQYLYQQWKKTPVERRKDKKSDSWNKVLLFDPQEKIFSGHVLETEKLDDTIIDWLNIEISSIKPFLKSLGIQTDKSDVVRLRNWLLNISQDEVKEYEIESISEFFLSNTLTGLAEGFLQEDDVSFQFDIDSKKHHIVNTILKKLLNSEGDNEYRLPVWASLNMLKIGSERNDLPKYLDKEDYDLIIKQTPEESLIKLFNTYQIIYLHEIYIDNLSPFERLEINFVFANIEEAVEHDEPFYRSWRDANTVRLIRQPYICYNASVKLGEEQLELGRIEKGDYYLDYNESETTIYYNKKLRWEDLTQVLNDEGQSNLAKKIEILIESRDKTLAAFYHTLTASGRDDFDDEDTRRILDNLKKCSIEEDRKEIIKDIESNERYSYDWFESYIRYLLSFENLAETTSQKSISFQSIKAYEIDGIISEKYFILEGANSLIPENIELFEGFNISIVFKNHKRENIIVEGVSKKGQNLLTYIPSGIEGRLIYLFSSAVNISINFSPVLDLIKRLYNGFTNPLIITPWSNINESVPAIHFIYGPPGTGKTTVLCKLLENEYIERPVFKALVLVPTNKAGDVLAKKLYSNNTNLSIVRLGSATDPELEAIDEELYQASLSNVQLDSCNIVITTIHRLPYYQIQNDDGPDFKLYDNEIRWDYIIFDESSMISLPYLVFALMSLKTHNPQAKLIVAGDPKQIPPVVDTSDRDLENLEIDDESIYKMFKINSFKEEEQNLIRRPIDTIENLSTQFRSVQQIGQLFSEFSYQNLLLHGRNYSNAPIKVLPDSFIESLKQPISLINFPIDPGNSVLMPKKLLFSSYHVYAAILAAELIKHLDKCNKDKTGYSIGIISPYKAQAMLMNKLIISMGISDSLNIYCDTVHGFQGDECDIVLFLINPNNTYYTGHKNSLLSKEYIYNVAISRAKDYLWIFNPFKSITNNPYVEEIKEILSVKNSNIVSNERIELELFKDPDFIVRNSYLTGHDNINVFGQVEMKYFIKAGDTAIDIQLKK